jgi:hypothetical protein
MLYGPYGYTNSDVCRRRLDFVSGIPLLSRASTITISPNIESVSQVFVFEDLEIAVSSQDAVEEDVVENAEEFSYVVEVVWLGKTPASNVFESIQSLLLFIGVLRVAEMVDNCCGYVFYAV